MKDITITQKDREELLRLINIMHTSLSKARDLFDLELSDLKNFDELQCTDMGDSFAFDFVRCIKVGDAGVNGFAMNEYEWDYENQIFDNVISKGEIK